MARVIFHPQAWVNDRAIAVDQEGDCIYDVGEVRADMKDNTDESDQLRDHPNAPAWVRDWDGPFWIEIMREEPDVAV